MSFALYLAVALGFCQGFLGFPLIICAPRLADIIAGMWNIPQESRRVSTAFCTVVVLFFTLLVNVLLAALLVRSSLDQEGAGKGWVIAFFAGTLAYTILPGIEWRIKRKKRK